MFLRVLDYENNDSFIERQSNTHTHKIIQENDSMII